MPERLDFSLTPFTKDHLPPIVACGNNVVAEEAATILMVWFVFLDTVLLAIRRVSFMIQLPFVLLVHYLFHAVPHRRIEVPVWSHSEKGERVQKISTTFHHQVIVLLTMSMCTNTLYYSQKTMFFN